MEISRTSIMQAAGGEALILPEFTYQNQLTGREETRPGVLVRAGTEVPFILSLSHLHRAPGTPDVMASSRPIETEQGVVVHFPGYTLAD